MTRNKQPYLPTKFGQWFHIKDVSSHHPIINITALKQPRSKLWTTSSWKWTSSMWPWWSCWIWAPHSTQLILISCWSDCAGMSAYMGKCLTGSAHICQIGATKYPSTVLTWLWHTSEFLSGTLAVHHLHFNAP